MSRSKRLPILKDKPRNYKRTSAYWRPVRRVWKHSMSTFPKNMSTEWLISDGDMQYIGDIIDFPNPKTIINDYDYCDYIWDWRYTGWIHLTEEELKEEIKQLSRK